MHFFDEPRIKNACRTLISIRARSLPELRFTGVADKETIRPFFSTFAHDGQVDAATCSRIPRRTYLLGNNITLATWHGTRQSFARSLSKIAQDGHDCYLIQFYFEGYCITQRKDARHRACLLIIDAAQPLVFETTAF